MIEVTQNLLPLKALAGCRTPPRLTYLVTFHCHHLMQRANLHPTPQAGNIQQHIKRSGQLPTMEKPLQILLPVRRESSPPSVLEAQIPLKVVLTNPAVDFAISRLLLVGVLLDEACFQLLVDV